MAELNRSHHYTFGHHYTKNMESYHPPIRKLEDYVNVLVVPFHFQNVQMINSFEVTLEL